MYNELGWESLQDRRAKHKTILFSKIVHNHTPAYLRQHLPPLVSETTHYNLRNQSNHTLPPTRTTLFSDSFYPSMTRYWNSAEENIKNISEPKALKRLLNEKIPSKNSYFYLGPRKFQITMSRIRMSCSDLAQHLHNMHIIDSPACACGMIESTQHFFQNCPLFTHSRQALLATVTNLGLEYTIDILLHGSPNIQTNKLLAISINEYLCATKRFALLSP